MLFMWLVTWLAKRTPKVEMFKSWNRWGVALAVCGAIDVTTAIAGAGGRAAATRRFGRKEIEKKAA